MQNMINNQININIYALNIFVGLLKIDTIDTYQKIKKLIVEMNHRGIGFIYRNLKYAIQNTARKSQLLQVTLEKKDSKYDSYYYVTYIRNQYNETTIQRKMDEIKSDDGSNLQRHLLLGTTTKSPVPKGLEFILDKAMNHIENILKDLCVDVDVIKAQNNINQTTTESIRSTVKNIDRNTRRQDEDGTNDRNNNDIIEDNIVDENDPKN
jgi:hypothetical protein